jgi:hypothetical protein
MPQAIIVIGNERRFMDAARPLIQYLRKKARFEHVSIVRGAYLTPAELKNKLRRAIRRVPNQDMLFLAYFGHGLKDWWVYALESQSRGLHFDYPTLAEILAAHSGQLTILNDCCHAESLTPHLQKMGINRNRCLLISACKSGETTIPGTGGEVLIQWERREVFCPNPVRETICHIGEIPYAPPFRICLRDWWQNARIKIRNALVKRENRRPTIIRLHSAPQTGPYACREEIVERTVGVRWGATLDHYFFPKPA